MDRYLVFAIVSCWSTTASAWILPPARSINGHAIATTTTTTTGTIANHRSIGPFPTSKTQQWLSDRPMEESGEEETNSIAEIESTDSTEPIEVSAYVVNGATSYTETTVADESNTDETVVDDDEVMMNLMFLQSISAITCRGEKATPEQHGVVHEVVTKLEACNPTPEPTANNGERLLGTWELTYTDTGHLFRSSPFFQAGRAVCSTNEQLEQYEWFCTMHRKALAISNIGKVRQILTPERIISEFEVEVGAVPFLTDFTPFAYSGGLPLTIDGSIVSSADWTTLNSTSYDLLMDTVQIKGSNIPLLRQALDNGLQLSSRFLGRLLEDNVPSYTNPRPVLRTTYLDDRFRIVRDMDDHIYIYVKTSNSTEPTDYADVDADLGVLKLLSGFNDAVTRIYI